MIKISNLVKRYGPNFAVDDISLEIAKGEIVGFLGPNGAGKSTTMNIVTGYLSATSGSVEIDGINVLEDPLGAKKKIGYLPEQPPLYVDMTVEEYLNFVYDLKGCTLDRKKHIAEVCEVVRIGDVYKRLISHLSKGYRQRVGIAQALIGNPPVIIFDEPTVGLDPKQILEVRNLIRALAKKHTVILSTHILAEVQAVCERVIIINKGKIIADELTENLTRTIEEGYRYQAKICGPQKEIKLAIEKLQSVKSVEITGEREADAYAFRIECESATVEMRKSLFKLCAENGWPIIALTPTGTDLESIFIRLVDRSDGINTGNNKSARRRAH